MQKLLLKNKDPFEPEVKFEDFVSEENSLKQTLSKLFGSLVLVELEREGRAVEIEIDEEKKIIKLKVEKKGEKKRLEKKGKTYKIRKEIERNILTLIYNLPVQETTQPFEKPEIAERKKMHAKLFSAKAAQSKQIIDNVPVRDKLALRIKAKEIKLPEYEIYEEKLPDYKNYEEMFDTMNDGGNLMIEIPYEMESIQYENPQEVLENRLTRIQLPREIGQSRQLIVYRTVVMQNARAGETVLNLLKRSGYRFTYSVYSYGILITSINGIPNGYKGAGWEFYVNGILANVGVSSYVLKDGDTVIFKLMKGGPCSPSNN